MVRTGRLQVTTPQSFSVVVGQGGSAGISNYGVVNETSGSAGESSSFGSVTALGGGGGNSSRSAPNGVGAGGAVQSGSVTAPQGGSGGGNGSSATRGSGGGGGGAGGAGSAGISSSGGAGGAGLYTALANATFGAGGNGARGYLATTGASASANTGNGGSAGGHGSFGGRSGGAGGSGFVGLWYSGSDVSGAGSSSYKLYNGKGGRNYSFTSDSALNLSSLDLNARLRTNLTSVVSGTGELAFTGPGRLTLEANNTYTGTTRISGGTLAIDGDQSAATGSVIVESGGTLGGSGTVGGDITVQSGGALNAGNSPGLLTATDGLVFETGSVFEWEMSISTDQNRGIQFDGVDVTGGTLQIQSGVTSDLIFNASGTELFFSDSFWDTSRTWLVFDNASSPSLSSGSIFSTINISSDSFGNELTDIRPDAGFYWNQQGNDIYLKYDPIVVVPEPAAWFLTALALGVVLVGGFRRRS